MKESTLEKQYELLHQQDLQIDKQRELINQKDQTYRSLEEELESTTAKLQQLQRTATTTGRGADGTDACKGLFEWKVFIG